MLILALLAAVVTLASWAVVLPMLFGYDPSRGRVAPAAPFLPDVPVVTFDSRGFA